jgi:hypothetical protein
MPTNTNAIDNIKLTLSRLRQDPNTKRHFPREFWDSVIQLTNIYSIEEVCQQLHINPTYLKQKMQIKEQALEFQEVFINEPQSLTSQDTIIIELSTAAGLKAKIQGTTSCLGILLKLFER